MNHQLLALSLLSTSVVQASTFCGTGSSQIPDDGISSSMWTIPVDADGIVSEVRLHLDVTHPWVGDLEINLRSPDGTSVAIIDRPGMPDGGWMGPWGCGGDDIDGFFDDDATTVGETMCSTTAVPVMHGNMMPAEPLATMTGLWAQGDWTVEFLDASPVDAGSVRDACLIIYSSPDCNANGVPDANDIENGTSEDIDGNGIPDDCDCPTDTTGDGVTGVDDLLMVISQFGQQQTDADVNGNGIVDIQDILLIIDMWNGC
jgi:subtilisin-like proprotein convertase family protein